MADNLERQETAADVREKFTEWLNARKSNKSKNGKLDGKTQERYLEYLDGSIEYFKEEYGEYKNVFEIKNPQEFGKILYAIEDHSGKYPNPNSFRNVHSGAMQYLAFLNGEGEDVGGYKFEGAKYGGKRFKYVPKRQRNHVHEPGGSDPSGGTNEEHSQYENQRNLIFFGAPGTGKSYELNRQKNILLNEDDSRCERVTFHPDYSYAHFVGTYKPKSDENNEIKYEYTPGPFLRIYVEARKHPDKKYVLLIEEINRANVAAVFGDVFQLLDRTKDGDSEYPVNASEDMQKYLEGDKQLGKNSKYSKKISIPENMYIWATMNSADQGVFPMDTAFKRRWDFVYLGINTGDDKIAGKMVPMGGSGMQEWNEVRKKINKLLSKKIGVNEDKQLGAFFISKDIIDNAEADQDTFISTFKNKVLMYLFEDAAKHKRRELFKDKNIMYSEICTKFDAEGLALFKGYGEQDEEDETEEIDEIETSAEDEGEQDS